VTELVEVALFTDAVEAAKTFYQRLVGAAPEAEWPGGAIFAAGAVKLLVHERARTIADGPPNEDHLALAVRDLDAACADLGAQGIQLLVEAHDYPWGRSAYLRDPDGRLVELSQAG
jgi:catechol 2,3-dioxygenase-like lactoylglutathione lyase family enzyme